MQTPAIPVDAVEVRNKEEIKAEGREVLQQAPNAALHNEEISGRLVIGNRGGLDIVAEMRSRFISLENQLVQKDASHALHENKIFKTAQANIQQDQKNLQLSKINAPEIGTPKDSVLDLTLSSNGYGQSRKRFLSMWKKMKLKKLSDEDRRIIGEGGRVPHFGDAIVDARMYFLGLRHDDSVFQELYGLKAEVVPLLGECFSNH